MAEESIGVLLLHAMSESGQALGPLVFVLVVVFLVFFRDVPKTSLLNMVKGVLVAAVGLTIFLTGVRVGFIPYARAMGSLLATDQPVGVVIVSGFALGLAATIAEPAVRILASQVDLFSSGYLKEKTILYTIAIGVAVSVAVNMVRIIYEIPLLYIVGPGYLLAVLLVFVSDSSFTAIAFDAGGVATGPMAVTFIMSLAIGVASGTGGDPATEGLGLVALVALAPILSVLLLGLVYKPPWRRRKHGS